MLHVMTTKKTIVSRCNIPVDAAAHTNHQELKEQKKALLKQAAEMEQIVTVKSHI